MTTSLYYTPPSDKTFEEVKKIAMDLWVEIDSDKNKFGYTTEKQGRIKDLKNVEDNVMTIIAMFDTSNQNLMLEKLSDDARSEVVARLIMVKLM